MVIFDIRPSIALLGAITLPCERCGSPAPQRALRRASRFTLFRVPLFPVATNYYLNCGRCDSTTRITRTEADGHVTLAENARIDAELDAEFGPEDASLADAFPRNAPAE